MKSCKLKVAIYTLLLTGIAMSLSAQQRGPGKGQKYCCEEKPHCERILPDLTEDQQKSIEELRISHLAKLNDLKADLSIKKAELQKLELADNYSQKAVEAKIDEMYVLKSKLAKERSKHRQQVRSLLTEEQKVIFDAHKSRGRGYGPGGGYGQGYGPGCSRAKSGCTGYGSR